MDLLFGISLDPLAVLQRHSLYDSDEEQEDEEASKQGELNSVFSVRGDSTQPLKGKTLAVAIGTTASVFLKSFLRLREEVAFSLHAEVDRVSQGKFFPSGSGSQTVSTFLSAEGGGQWMVCTHETELRVEFCNLWTEKLFEQGRPSQVVVFLCRPSHEFFSTVSSDEDHTHILRALQTSTWPHLPTATPLETPNTVKGEAAAILTHCEVHGVPASLTLLYSSSSQTEKERVLSLSPLLRHPLLADLPMKSKEEASQQVKALLPRPRADLSTLYT